MKIEDAETSSIKNGKKVVGRLEERIRELVGQVDDEARRMAEAVKNLKKTERGVKECNYRAGEDSKNSERIKVSGNKLSISVVHSHWSRFNEARLSLVKSFIVLLRQSLLCHKEPAKRKQKNPSRGLWRR